VKGSWKSDIFSSKNIQTFAVEVWAAQSLALRNLVLRLLRFFAANNYGGAHGVTRPTFAFSAVKSGLIRG
jgi:hypothetical protein